LEIPIWTAADIDADGAIQARVQWPAISAPPARQADTEMIEGDTPEAVAAALVDKLTSEKVV
jgi:electron transfer flavoprotein alpha/beta subunit